MKILFPTELEAAPFRALCPDAAVEICGVGMAQTSACVARLLGEGYRKFLLAGIAGAYSEELAKGDVVAVLRQLGHHSFGYGLHLIVGLGAEQVAEYGAHLIEQGTRFL